MIAILVFFTMISPIVLCVCICRACKKSKQLKEPSAIEIFMLMISIIFTMIFIAAMICTNVEKKAPATIKINDNDKVYIAIKDGELYNNYYHTRDCKTYIEWCTQDDNNMNLCGGLFKNIKILYPDIQSCHECVK